MNVKFKILIPLIIFTFVCLAALLVTSVVVYNSTLDEAASKRLDVSIKAVEEQIERYKEISRMAAIQLAGKPELKDAIKSRNREEIVEIVRGWVDFSKVEYSTIVDENEIVLARTHLDSYGDKVTSLPENKIIFEQDFYTGVMRTSTAPLVIATSVRIHDEDDKTIGYLLTGFRLDNPEYVDKLKAITGSEVSIFLGSHRISTTIMQGNIRFTGENADKEASKQVSTGNPYFGIINVANRDILTKHIPLKGPNDIIIGMLAVGEFTTANYEKKDAFLAKALIIALITFILVIVIAELIVDRIDKRLAAVSAKLQEANNHVKVMFDSSPIVCILLDENMNAIDCNLETMNLFGVKSKQEFIDNFYQFSPQNQPDGEKSQDLIIQNHLDTFKTGYKRVEWMLQNAQGEQIPGEVILIRVKYGKKDMIAIYVRDLRKEKEFIRKLEHEIAEKIEAENTSKAKSAFFARMSHEIRTPMNAILGISEIQLQNKSLDSDTKNAMSRIYEAGHFLLSIINDILDLSKIEADKMELMPVKYEIASLINDTVHLNIMRNSKPVDLELDLDENIPFSMVGDELRIKQILNNLLSNAFKYTDEGLVKLSAYATPENDMTNLHFTISDTGKGMTKEQTDKIFDDYSRFVNKSNITGTGLGMSIVKNLVRIMNGEIYLKSEVGKGTTVTVVIPQKSLGPRVLGKELTTRLKQFKFNSKAARKKQQINYEPMPYGKILIVDDVETNLYVAKGLLIPYQLQVEMAGSGKAAIDKVKNGNVYDIIFMDHMMPEMDGIEATKKIRELGYTAPIIALTANAVAGQAENFLSQGFDDFISKPIDMRQMNEVLNKLIRNKQTEETIENARKYKKGATASSEPIDAGLLAIFAKDAKKAIENMSAVYENIDNASEKELDLYSINAHAMKGALSNISEPQCAEKAFELEKAGKDGDREVIKNDTKEFLDILNKIILKIEANTKKKPEVLTEDKDYLRAELKKIAVACSDYDKKTAKNTLAAIKEKPWTKETEAILDKITELLLHSEFEKVVEEIERV